MTEFVPADANEVRDVVAWAMAEEQPLELMGGGSKRPLGRPLQVAHLLDLSRLSGILDYEPAELVLTARAATPLAEIEAALAANRQRLAFEPPDWRRLLDTEARAQTIGGVLACNLAGPRRIVAGAARDHFLGFHGVNGRGELFKAGGRVVKNVTGYDLCKLLAGSHGTLAAMTEISIKVLPRPDATRTLLLCGLDDAAAIRAMVDALNSPHEISGAAHLPAAAVAQSSVASLGQAVTALRLEGPEPSVAYRLMALRQELTATGMETLADDASETLWREIGDAAVLTSPGSAVWRVSVAPASGARVAAAIAAEVPCELFYDWGGGLVWVAVAGQDDCGAAAVRGAVAAQGGGQSGGHAMLLRAPDAARTVQVFETLAPPLAALSARVKTSFDPRGVLNPGRIHAGL